MANGCTTSASCMKKEKPIMGKAARIKSQRTEPYHREPKRPTGVYVPKVDAQKARRSFEKNLADRIRQVMADEDGAVMPKFQREAGIG